MQSFTGETSYWIFAIHCTLTRLITLILPYAVELTCALFSLTEPQFTSEEAPFTLRKLHHCKLGKIK